MDHPLTMSDAEHTIQRIANDPVGVGFRDHCLEQMVKRGIDALDIIRILRNPSMVRPAYPRNGEWRYRVQERPGKGLA